jgi:hypothetical protein
MGYMFEEASRFRQDISSWCVRNIASEPYYFDDGAPIERIDRVKPEWGTKNGCSSGPDEIDTSSVDE